MKTLLALLIILFCIPWYTAKAQNVFWSEDFNNGCTQNCLVSTYNSTNGAWSVVSSGNNGSHANNFFVSCSENGNAVGSCGSGCGNNATLHIGSIPCTLCLFCPSGDCGASYNAGPTFLGEDPTTNRRAVSPVISTIGKSNITLSFKYLENGQGNTDDAYLEYTTGSGWISLINPPKTSSNCAPQGEWTLYSLTLPSGCDNVANLQLGIVWKNNSDGIGTDPSFAIDDIELSTTNSASPSAGFLVSSAVFCDSTCITFTDTSIGNPSSYMWYFPGGTPSFSTSQNPGTICYNVPGNYDVSLVVSNAGGTDSITQIGLIQVNACYIPSVYFTASDTIFCEEFCIDFFDLSLNSPNNWQWSFPGANPSTSSLQNPTNICYLNQGTYTVSLIASNGTGGDTSTIVSYIQVLPNPPAPVITVLGGNTLICSPGISYQWYLNSSPISGAVFQVYTALQPGSYTVSINDSAGCFAASQPVLILDVSEITENQYTVYPNPVKDILYIDFASKVPQAIRVYSVTGQLLVESLYTEPTMPITYQVNVENLDMGLYFVEIQFQDKIMRKVFVRAE